MYKYCRDIMWSVEEDAFVATVAELPGCKAVGKTVIEVVNNLEVAIEKWIEKEKKMGHAIPSPLYYEPIDYVQISEDEKIPYFDSMSRTWKVVTEYGREEGDAVYIASEFVKSGLYYPFHSKPSHKEQHPDHRHDFTSVVEFLLKGPEFFSIEGFEDYYSQQERDLLNKIVMKLFYTENKGLNKIEEFVDEISKSVDDVDETVDGVKKTLRKCNDGLERIISQIEYMNKLLDSQNDGGKG